MPFGEPAIAVVRIVDDDRSPTVEINDVIVEEGESGSTSAGFTVRLSAASAKTINVTATTQAGTATPGQDFGAGSVVLTYLPGQTSKQIVVFVAGDITVEGIEHFFVNLVNPVNTTIADGQGAGSIIDDDALVLLMDAHLAESDSAQLLNTSSRDFFDQQ